MRISRYYRPLKPFKYSFSAKAAPIKAKSGIRLGGLSCFKKKVRIIAYPNSTSAINQFRKSSFKLFLRLLSPTHKGLEFYGAFYKIGGIYSIRKRQRLLNILLNTQQVLIITRKSDSQQIKICCAAYFTQNYDSHHKSWEKITMFVNQHLI